MVKIGPCRRQMDAATETSAIRAAGVWRGELRVRRIGGWVERMGGAARGAVSWRVLVGGGEGGRGEGR